MKESDKTYFPSLQIGKESYDFKHLNPFTIVVESKKAKKNLRVRVRFSNHCFSRGYIEGQDSSEQIINKGDSKPRVFCPTRYRLSFSLQELISSLNSPKVKVSQTKTERNWVYSIKIDDPEGPYHLFFEISRSPKNKRQYQDLEMVIESAYHETIRPPQILGHMKFLLLCSKVYLNEKVSTKR